MKESNENNDQSGKSEEGRSTKLAKRLWKKADDITSAMKALFVGMTGEEVEFVLLVKTGEQNILQINCMENKLEIASILYTAFDRAKGDIIDTIPFAEFMSQTSGMTGKEAEELLKSVFKSTATSSEKNDAQSDDK